MNAIMITHLDVRPTCPDGHLVEEYLRNAADRFATSVIESARPLVTESDLAHQSATVTPCIDRKTHVVMRTDCGDIRIYERLDGRHGNLVVTPKSPTTDHQVGVKLEYTDSEGRSRVYRLNARNAEKLAFSLLASIADSKIFFHEASDERG